MIRYDVLHDYLQQDAARLAAETAGQVFLRLRPKP